MGARSLIIHPDDRSMLATIRDVFDRGTAESEWLYRFIQRVDYAPPATAETPRCLLCATGMRRRVESEYDGLAMIGGMSVCGQHFELVFQSEPATLGGVGVTYDRWLKDNPDDFEPKP